MRHPEQGTRFLEAWINLKLQAQQILGLAGSQPKSSDVGAEHDVDEDAPPRTPYDIAGAIRRGRDI